MLTPKTTLNAFDSIINAELSRYNPDKTKEHQFPGQPRRPNLSLGKWGDILCWLCILCVLCVYVLLINCINMQEDIVWGHQQEVQQITAWLQTINNIKDEQFKWFPHELKYFNPDPLGMKMFPSERIIRLLSTATGTHTYSVLERHVNKLRTLGEVKHINY